MGDVLRVKFWQDVCLWGLPSYRDLSKSLLHCYGEECVCFRLFKDCEPRFWYSDWGLEVVYEFFELMYGMEIN